MQHQCSECGSERVAPNVRLADAGTGGLLGRLRARLCADCGHLELFAEDPVPIYLEHVRAGAGAPPEAASAGAAVPANVQCPSCGSVIPAASASCEVCGWSPASA